MREFLSTLFQSGTRLFVIVTLCAGAFFAPFYIPWLQPSFLRADALTGLFTLGFAYGIATLFIAGRWQELGWRGGAVTFFLKVVASYFGTGLLLARGSYPDLFLGSAVLAFVYGLVGHAAVSVRGAFQSPLSELSVERGMESEPSDYERLRQASEKNR